MINYWWVTRPKRKLNSIPEVLSTFVRVTLNQKWQQQRGMHLSFEDELEKSGLKKLGERRDQTGGGARTYKAWLSSLGLIFTHEKTQEVKLTLAGEAIINGESPVLVLRNQILKYQFPSSFSLSKGVNVNERFKVRPFRFLFRLLLDDEVCYLTEEEIAKIVIVHAENETETCFQKVKSEILEFRIFGDSSLEKDFFEKYASSKGTINTQHPYSHLLDTANTLINWIEYTQYAFRNDGKLRILNDQVQNVQRVLSVQTPFIDRPNNQEYFQRKFGIDPNHKKDTRDFSKEETVTSKAIEEMVVRNEFIKLSSISPIVRINSTVISAIYESTGINVARIESILNKLYPHGAIGPFLSNFFELAFSGRDNATEFEIATHSIFKEIFGYESFHVGPLGLTPDILVNSSEFKYLGIIDNKAYSTYSITNDHRNRMVHNYIRGVRNYSKIENPLGFFLYISGGFGSNIDNQISSIVGETGINGSAISISNFIELIDLHLQNPLGHNQIKSIFSMNRQVLLADIDKYKGSQPRTSKVS